jgi:hypothetical protein
MKNKAICILSLLIMLVVCSCAYRYYLGMHGPSIKRYPDIHANVTQDGECLECHHPQRDPTGPPTTHPQFKGCLACHNDDIE